MHAWAGAFGDEYFDRCEGRHMEAREHHLGKILSHVTPQSFLEAGAGAGENLQIIAEKTSPEAVVGYDLNAKAVQLMKKRGIKGFQHSILEPSPVKADFVLTWGTLCTLSEEHLPTAYQSLYDTANKYLCLCEYYAPKYEPISYRGGLIYRGDHAGAFMEKYPLKLVNYGFAYRNDPAYPLSDISWFLLEKQ